MRYSEVTHVNGVAVDMVITCESDGYMPANPHSNGQHWNPAQAARGQAFGTLNLQAGTKVSVMVHFFESGTTDHIGVPLFYFSIFDLDNGPGDEQVVITGFHEVFLTPGSKLKYSNSSQGFLFEPAGTPEKSLDLISPSNLSPRQKRHAATFLFQNTSSFPLTLICGENHSGGEWTMIFGSAPINGTYGMLPVRSPEPLGDAVSAHAAGRVKCFPIFDVEMWTEHKKELCCKRHEEVRARVCPDTTSSRGPGHSSMIASKVPSSTTTSSTQPPRTTASSSTKLGTTSTTGSTTSRAPTTSTSFVPYTGCGKVVSCELKLNKVVHNNLGGLGPDKTQPSSLRFANVCTDKFAGGSLDLVVESEGNYEARTNSSNGLIPERPYGLISVRSNSSVKLRLRFVHSGTDKPSVVRSSFFSFFDLGQKSASGSQFVTVHSCQTYIVAPDGYVHHEPLVNGVRLTSTTQSVGEDAPVNPLQCSSDQAKRTAIMLFENISEFPVELEVRGEGRIAEDGRDFIFGGRSCLTEKCDHLDSPESKQVVTTTLGTGNAMGNSTAAVKYDCLSGLPSWKADWSYEKKAWCCEQEELGCYDCSKPGSVWTSDHREFCCKSQQIGCQSTLLVDKSLARHGFDCQHSLLMWKASWSFEKKDWCCKHETLGCYDCSGSDATWLLDQREFCCKSQQVGCTPEADSMQQCLGDPTAFTFQQRQWCCKTQSIGCFSCVAPNLGWTPPEIDYCCKAQQVGCELSAHSPPPFPLTTPPAVSAGVDGVASSSELTRPYDCQDGLADWQLGWSEEKKGWCCTHRAIGCASNLNFQKRFMQSTGKNSRGRLNSSGTASALTWSASLVMGISSVAGLAAWSRAGARRAMVAPVSTSYTLQYTPASELLAEAE